MNHLIRVAELAACLLPLVLQPARAAAPPLTEEAAHAIAVDAYLYFYPLIAMDITRKQSTNIEEGKEFGKGPMNVFTNVPAFPPADLKVVARINFDTLYSIAWLDLTKEPQIVSRAGHRRPILPFADARHVDGRFASPAGDDWHASGQFPCHAARLARSGSRGLARIDAPTPYVWIIGRTKTDGPAIMRPCTRYRPVTE